MDIKTLNIHTLKNAKELIPFLYKESLEISIPFFILHKTLYEKGESILKSEFELTQSELDILASLLLADSKEHTLSPTQLYEIMLFTSGGLTKVLKKLESKKLICRVENLEDKRSKLVQLTKRGKETAIKALDKVTAFEDTYFSKLNSNEQDEFKKLLYKMLADAK